MVDKNEVKTLKYKLIYGGNLTVSDLLKVVMCSDAPVARLASVTIESYITRLEKALLEEKMKNSELMDTGNKVISIKELPEIMQHDILSSIDSFS